MKAEIILIVICLNLFLCGCTGRIDQGRNDVGITGVDESALEDQAKMVLIDFHTYLNLEKYDQAVDLYGGSYDVLLGYNPTLSEEDKEVLLQAACEFNGFMCLDVLSAELIGVEENGEFAYEVKFVNPDGSEFVLGPCCGATEEEMPPKSSFTVHVECKEDGSCLVMDLPPYVP